MAEAPSLRRPYRAMAICCVLKRSLTGVLKTRKELVLKVHLFESYYENKKEWADKIPLGSSVTPGMRAGECCTFWVEITMFCRYVPNFQILFSFR